MGEWALTIQAMGDACNFEHPSLPVTQECKDAAAESNRAFWAAFCDVLALADLGVYPDECSGVIDPSE